MGEYPDPSVTVQSIPCHGAFVMHENSNLLPPITFALNGIKNLIYFPVNQILESNNENVIKFESSQNYTCGCLKVFV